MIEKSSNGTVTADHGLCNAGVQVTLTATPNTHYITKFVTVSYQENGADKTLTPDQNGSFTMTAANVTVSAKFIGMWQWLQDRLDGAQDGETITLPQDIVNLRQDTLPPLTVSNGKKVTIDLNGYKIDGAQLFTRLNVITIEDGELTITDTSVGKTGTITGGNYTYYEDDDDYKAGGIIVKSAGKLVLKGGNITGNKGWHGGVDASKGILVIDGNPVIQGNTDENGDARNVYIEDGTFDVLSLAQGARIGVYKADANGQAVKGRFADWTHMGDADPARSFTGDDGFSVRRDGGYAMLTRIYSVSPDPGIVNGSVVSISVGGRTFSGETLKDAWAEPGDLVTVTVEPDWGYSAGGMGVARDDNVYTDIKVDQDASDPNCFSFTMIDCDVTVKAYLNTTELNVSATAIPDEGNTALIQTTSGVLPSVKGSSNKDNTVDVHVWANTAQGYAIRDVKYAYEDANGDPVEKPATREESGDETFDEDPDLAALGQSTHYTFKMPGADTVVKARFWKDFTLTVDIDEDTVDSVALSFDPRNAGASIADDQSGRPRYGVKCTTKVIVRLTPQDGYGPVNHDHVYIDYMDAGSLVSINADQDPADRNKFTFEMPAADATLHVDCVTEWQALSEALAYA